MGVGYRNVPPDQYNNDFGGEPGSLSNVMPLQQSVIRNIKQHAYSKDDKLTVIVLSLCKFFRLNTVSVFVYKTAAYFKLYS